ncbi:2OG-Fe(II) oxygenase family protein [Microvirga alba]|uniref:2OG-Fe(II) oxygenase n=1 Tax=Microvirga alba TaxID=2791025 RepID=A0A931FQ38_9HYPH|nr:2OG-Fe(II) oxygenase [Microvirga alba]MBF9233078.1 2OG-Fe(II) oxygenase [Microvirga alba]
MNYLDLDALAETPLTSQPFEHVIVPNFVPRDAFRKVVNDFPTVPGAGSHPPAELKIKGHFAELIRELHADAFREAVEEKFDVDLAGRPTMYTVRGFLRMKDGAIHTDSTTKIITVLLYLNEDWDHDGGRLRLLKNGTDLEDYVAEIPPVNGTLLVFRRSNNSWHGHKPHEGRRRAIQFNWVTEQRVVTKEQSRHRLSTRIKKIKSFFSPAA